MTEGKKNSGKAPSYQMYPRDWNENQRLKMCTYAAQGLWIRVCNTAFFMPKPGVFSLENHSLSAEEIIALLPGKTAEKRKLFNELSRWNVIKKNGETFFCNRIMKDYELRQIRKKAGKLGGNPNLSKPKPVKDLNQNPNQKTTPSTSTSTSTSGKVLKVKKKAILLMLKKEHGICFRWFLSNFKTHPENTKQAKRDSAALETYAKICTVLIDRDKNFNHWLTETLEDIVGQKIGYPGSNKMFILALNNKIMKMEI